jgi:hypothetical protein
VIERLDGVAEIEKSGDGAAPPTAVFMSVWISPTVNARL